MKTTYSKFQCTRPAMAWAALTLLGLTAACLPATPADAASTTLADFSHGLDGWTVVSGRFDAEGGTLNGRALANEDKLARIVLEDRSWTDCRAEARIQFGAFSRPSADFGLIVRYQDVDNYYLVAYKVAKQLLTIERVFEGKWQPLAKVEVATIIEAGAWHDFSAEVIGKRLVAGIDGESLLELPDVEIPAGTAGFLVYFAEAQCSDFKIISPADSTPDPVGAK